MMFAGIALAFLAQNSNFALHDNDRVAFYGDSITDNNPWTYYVAEWVTERMPQLNIYWVNAAESGDRVTGGYLGPIDTRLTRDLFTRKPTVITIMLGMNDAGYRPLDQSLFETYQKGYSHILDRIAKEATARVWLFQPTPYDDITRAPNWQDGGYSGVLQKYGDFLVKLAKERGCLTVDQTSTMNAMLTAANKLDPKLAATLLPDRVHPNWAAEYQMAKTLILAWGGSPVVSATNVDWANGTSNCVNGTISNWKDGSFTLQEDALPMWIKRDDPSAALVLKASDFDNGVNSESLKVNNMPAGTYSLSIDGKSVGTFTADQFAAGIQLQSLDTPMTNQAHQVQDDINTCLQLRYLTWRQIEVDMQDLHNRDKDDAVKSMYKLADFWYQKARKDARTVPHQFKISPSQ